MGSHGREKGPDGRGADSISDEEELDDEYESDDGFESSEEEDEGWLPGDEGRDSGGAKGCSSGSGGGAVQCPECGKSFRNHKAMFGHLRSHPNRGYKGATPPVTKLKLPSSETAAASPPSPTPSPGTDQPPTQPSGGDEDDAQSNVMDVLAACGLLALEYLDSQEAQPPPSFGEGETGADAIDEQAGGGTGGPVTGSHVGAEAGNLVLRDEHSGSSVETPPKRRNVSRKIRVARKKKIKGGPYFCKHCNAECLTNQALGGHVAGHHKKKKVPALKGSSSSAHQGMAARSQKGELQVQGGRDDDDGWRDSGLSLQRGQLSMAASLIPRQSREASGGQMMSQQSEMRSDGGQMMSQQSERRSDGGQMMSQHSERRSDDGLAPAVPPSTPPTPTPAPAPAQADDRHGRRPLNIDLNVAAPEEE